MYKQTCEATHVRGEQSPDVLDLRMSCLNERLNGFHALTDVFADATGEVVENAVSATNALATLDRCADVSTLRAVIRPPDDPAAVARVAEVRKQLAALKARFDAGRWKDGLKDGPKLTTQAREVGYEPLLAESLMLLGKIFLKAGNHREAEKTFVEAFATADASRHDEVRAEVAEALVYVVGYQAARFDEAYRWAQIATAILSRLGGHDLLRAWLFNDLACVLNQQGRHPEAIQSAMRAIELKRKTLGSEHPDVGISEINVAIALQAGARPEEALTHVQRALVLMEKGLGASHPDVATPLMDGGEILSILGRRSEAQTDFERARTILERELGPESLWLSYVLTDIGTTYLADGDPDRALPALERAYKIQESQEPEPSKRADVTFALARALWESHSRSRSRILARDAEDEYGKASTKDKVIEVQNWLRDRSAS
jgi:tetratricopeptide (TPR) repeat protein